MLYPMLKRKSKKQQTVSAFRGYERRLRTSEGAFYDTENLSTAHYPLLSVRQRRGEVMALSAPQGLAEKDALAYIDGGTLYYNNAATPLAGMSAGEKQLVSMGAYLCIFPDKLYYNTQDAADYGAMESEWSYEGQVEYAMCSLTGEEFGEAESAATAPDNPQEGEYWINTADGTLSQYSVSMKMWVEVESVYTKLTFTTQGQLPTAFSQYDGVTLAGASMESANGSKILYAVGGSPGTAPDFADAERDYIIIAGEPLSAKKIVTDERVTIKRSVPDMDFVCQCANRLWGCRYGNDGEQNLNELYCSALGDFKNWEQYMGLSTDSWRASVGSDGVFTGAVSYLGTPLFFKENCIHRVSVSSTGAHQVGETVCRGVQKGSHKSLVVVNETLYYKSASDVCAYQGAFPESVSAALGSARYRDAVAGALGDCYYISMLDEGDVPNLFVLDIAKGLWMREDAFRAAAFARVDNELYALSGKTLYAMRGTTGAKEPPVKWRAETGMLMCEYPRQKYLTRVLLRAWMDAETEAEVHVEYDSSGVWEYAGRMHLATAGSAELPLRLRRCDHARIRLSGRGEMRLVSLTREITEG